MKYIALTGQIASGKTAVAQALEAQGYLLISYTNLLKEYVAEALTAVGIPTSLDTILDNKEQYRALIQEFGSVIGFDEGGRYVDEAMGEWAARGKPKAVFDNVRSHAQARAIEDYGFTLVQLKAHIGTRTQRLRARGLHPASVLLRESHPIESGLNPEVVDLEITTDTSTPEMVADFLASYTFFEEEEEEEYDAFEGHPDDAYTFEELADEEDL